ncbi:response regulator [Marinobacter zhejiangensis]|uniref:CheY chemotaxis protein or a CheY-like REC (Receiver) domain n=1 Tax=Marinobacter zhejiangensis TaxID=488535 RepID=A0A1I4R8V9_9GAMM|nr:response regulator [Marinobacter zhejiangensis]SFM48687.1 CheY chemotaxis protein or a CheY-like REC (receiver) domain [Marinobacter zhejiangensis]
MTGSSSYIHDNPFKKLRYLIIDDFESFRLSMRQMLRSFGAEHINVANNAAAAIQRCTYEHFDVVLCDYNLGEGKNGQHILEELRHKKLLKRASLFLMVTAETSKEMVMGAREYQPDAYLTKPINRAMLEKRLVSLVEQRRALLPINRAIDLENYPEAITLCLQSIPRFPRYKTWLLKTLADLYQRVGDLSHAGKIYADVLAQRDLSWARLGKGKVLLADQRFDDAIEVLKALVEDHPDYMEGYDLLAEAQTQQGRLAPAQKTLQKATELSPHALLRQKQLATVAQANHDMTTASQAWRKTVQLGAHSIHDQASHYLSLGSVLCELSDGDTSDTGQAQANEARSALARMQQRFPDVPEASVRSQLIDARLSAGQGQITEAEQALSSIANELADLDELSADVSLDYARTLFRINHADKARSILGRLAQRFEHDNQVLQQIEALFDEPVGFRQKMEARNLNKSGIQAFEEGSLDGAADAFRRALSIVPSHTALNLNLVQVLMKQYHSGGDRQACLTECQTCLARVANLPEQHRQYPRYKALVKKLESLQP